LFFIQIQVSQMHLYGRVQAIPTAARVTESIKL